MNALNLPYSYGCSGIRMKYGLGGSTAASLHPVSRWIVSAIKGGDGRVLGLLRRVFLAVQSNFQPANVSPSSDVLHAFVSTLCFYFSRRLHLERHNRKWTTKVPEERRLTDEDVTAFVEAIKPAAFSVLFTQAFEEDRKSVFSHLAALRPDLIVPDLLSKFRESTETLTEPHRFPACVAGLYACARALSRFCRPEQLLDLLMALLPGIDVNDMWKCSDIFILLSDLMEVSTRRGEKKHSLGKKKHSLGIATTDWPSLCRSCGWLISQDPRAGRRLGNW